MNCKDIIAKYLKDNGFDGLVHLETECGCPLDEMPICDCFGPCCEPAYKHEDSEGWTMRLYADSHH